MPAPLSKPELAAIVSAEVRKLMLGALNDELFWAEMAAAGPFHFRAAFTKQFRALFPELGACDTVADVVHRFLTEKWKDTHPGVTPGMWLDNVRVISPPTQDEIDRAWVHEIGSSDAAMRAMYEGSCRTRTGLDVGAKTTPAKVRS
jgi:hypothetical protein